MAADNGPEKAVRAAQSIMQRDTPTLIVDGRWGSFTNAAYERANGTDRTAIDGVLRAYGLTALGLFQQNQAAKAASDQAYLTAKSEARRQRSLAPNSAEMQQVDQAITDAANATGVPRAWILGFARLESGLNPRAVNGSSRGLLQIQPRAWKDAQDVDPTIGRYGENVFDPRMNALAGARYLALNRDRIVKKGYTGPITPAVLYLAHQQGADGFVELWKAAQGQQGTGKYVTVEKMQRNPPQDGRGVTTDKSEFYNRWLAVAERKIGQ